MIKTYFQSVGSSYPASSSTRTHMRDGYRSTSTLTALRPHSLSLTFPKKGNTTNCFRESTSQINTGKPGAPTSVICRWCVSSHFRMCHVVTFFFSSFFFKKKIVPYYKRLFYKLDENHDHYTNITPTMTTKEAPSRDADVTSKSFSPFFFTAVWLLLETPREFWFN